MTSSPPLSLPLFASIIAHLTSIRSDAKDPSQVDAAVASLCRAFGLKAPDLEAFLPSVPLSKAFEPVEKFEDTVERDVHYQEFRDRLRREKKGGLQGGDEGVDDRLFERHAREQWWNRCQHEREQSGSRKAKTKRDDVIKVGTDKEKEKAEKLKNEGNTLLAQQKFPQAIDKYTEALRLHSTHIYFANRAAAYINLKRNAEAESDCQRAVEMDPTYHKAHYRLGQALYNQERYAEAVTAYEKALELTGNDATTSEAIEEQLALARSKLDGHDDRVEESESDASDPMAGLGSGLGGMDLSSLLNNPMISQMMNNPAFQQMAQSMMGNLGSAGGDAPAENASASASTTRNAPRGSPPMPNVSADLQSKMSSYMASPQGQALRQDPELKPIMDDVQKNGPSALMKHMNNPRVMAKLQGLVSQMGLAQR